MLQIIIFFYFNETVLFVLPEVYEEKSLSEVIDLTMRSLDVIKVSKITSQILKGVSHVH